MRSISIIMFFLVGIVAVPANTCAQNFTIDTAAKALDVSGDLNGVEFHFNSVSKQPEFSGGKKAWRDFLRSNINVSIPFSNRAKPGTYQVMIRFIIGSDGKVRDIGADSNCGYGMESEVIRCIQKTPDWIPAETKSGTKVSFTMRTLVTFVVKPSDVIVHFQ